MFLFFVRVVCICIRYCNRNVRVSGEHHIPSVSSRSNRSPLAKSKGLAGKTRDLEYQRSPAVFLVRVGTIIVDSRASWAGRPGGKHVSHTRRSSKHSMPGCRYYYTSHLMPHNIYHTPVQRG